MQEILGSIQRALGVLSTLLLNPTMNLTAAFLLYGVIIVALLIFLVVAIMFLMGAGEDDEPGEPQEPVVNEGFENTPVGEVFEGLEPGAATATGKPAAQAPARRKGRTPAPPMGPGGRLLVAFAAALVLLVAWVGTGYTTSAPSVCKGCHWPASEHAKAAAGTDPHAQVACVACHEPGGTFGRYLGDVPARLAHFVDTQSKGAQSGDYGAVTRAACSHCHASALSRVSTDQARGLKMSHREPLAASATCLDCHTFRTGVVAGHNAGMAPCLRCHGSKKASAACATCHDEKAATAARVRTASFSGVQIPEVSCGGCHDEKKQCDWCHGVRLPHTLEFMTYAHSRAGAVDFWYNGGKTCGRCHTATRRPCQKCHSKIMGRAHGTGSALARTHRRATSQACNTCHLQWAYAKSRDFCRDLCHSPAAVAASPR
jgi:hypothetical protein